MPNVIVVLVKNGSVYNTAVVPWRVNVDEGNQTITWRASGPGARFPETNYFWWKTEPAPAPVPTRTDAQTLTLSYNNDHGGVWVYGIRIENDETSIAIDPEVDNGPPR